jgi:hypothetical protein
MLRRIFGPKRENVTEDWRRLHTEELHSLYSSPNIIGVIKLRMLHCMGHVVCIWKINAHKILVEGPERKRPLRRRRHMKADLKEIGFQDVD